MLRGAIGEAWVTNSYERAEGVAASAPFPIVTADGEVFRGGHLVSGGHPKEARGILETKRDIRSCAHVSKASAKRWRGWRLRPPTSNA